MSMGSRAKSRGRSRIADRRIRLIVAEGAVLVAMIILAISVQSLGHSTTTAVLDLMILILGVIGLAFTISEPGLAVSWWLLFVFGVPMAGAVVQLFWSSSITEAVILILLLPIVLDGLADLFLLAGSFWQRRRTQNHKTIW